jgi:hypothetical protein
MGKPDVTIDLGMLMTKEVTYKGSFRYGVSHHASWYGPVACTERYSTSQEIILSPSPLWPKGRLT